MFNITTIFTKMVQNYFEVMINYIIAGTLHARRNNVRSLVWVLVNHFFKDDNTLVINSYRIVSLLGFTLELKPSTSSRVCLICTGLGLALVMMFLHSFHL